MFSRIALAKLPPVRLMFAGKTSTDQRPTTRRQKSTPCARPLSGVAMILVNTRS
jgi:hypothetical protein